MTDLAIRGVIDDDRGFLGSMLYEAAHWRRGTLRPPREEALASPELRVYIDGWGRAGDRGIIAVAGIDPLGAAWYRAYSEAEHGYGFVDARTPELTIAVAPPRRGLGIGRALLAALVAQARLDGVTALSLSVERDNPARRLYEQSGFEPVPQPGNDHTMVARLPPRRDAHSR